MKFIIRDTTQQVGEHTEKQLVQWRQKQQAEIHTWRERAWVFPLRRRRTVKRPLTHLHSAVLRGLCLLLASYLLSFSSPDLSWDFPQHVCATFFQDGFQPRGLWDHILASHIMGWPLLFWPQGAFLHTCNVSLAPRMGNMWPPDQLLRQGLAHLCFYHDGYLKVPTGDKSWLFFLFWFLLPL